MDNVTKRTLQAEMGDAFMGWADGFFGTMNDDGQTYKYLNEAFSRELAFDEFMKATKMNKWTQTKFKKAIHAYCKWNSWVMNPKEMHNSQNRIIKTIDGKSQEVIFIDTSVSIKNAKVEKIITDEDDDSTVFDRD